MPKAAQIEWGKILNRRGRNFSDGCLCLGST